MASSNVDFPEPFSPTKKVIGLVSSNCSSSLIDGIVKGYCDVSSTSSFSSVILLRNIFSLPYRSMIYLISDPFPFGSFISGAHAPFRDKVQQIVGSDKQHTE